MKFRDFFKASNMRHWRQAAYWIFAMGIGTLMPVWGGALSFKLTGTWPGFVFFISHGEFYIYSASLLSSSIFILANKGRFNFAFLLSLFLILSSSLLYATAISSYLWNNEGKLDYEFLILSTLIIFFLAVVITFFVKLFEEIEYAPDVSKSREKDLKSLEDRFDKTD